MTYFGLHSLQHRGQEGAGIVANNSGKLDGHRDLGLLAEVFQKQEQLNALEGTAAIGHVRYATAGTGSVDNIQPFYLNFMIVKLVSTQWQFDKCQTFTKTTRKRRRYFSFQFRH